jgi:hypothetical protein
MWAGSGLAAFKSISQKRTVAALVLTLSNSQPPASRVAMGVVFANKDLRLVGDVEA